MKHHHSHVVLVLAAFANSIVGEENSPCLCPTEAIVPAAHFEANNQELHFCGSKFEPGKGTKLQGACEKSGLYVCSGPNQPPLKMIKICDSCNVQVALKSSQAITSKSLTTIHCRKDGQVEKFVTAALSFDKDA